MAQIVVFINSKVLLDEGEVALRAKVKSISGVFTEGNERRSLSEVFHIKSLFKMLVIWEESKYLSNAKSRSSTQRTNRTEAKKKHKASVTP